MTVALPGSASHADRFTFDIHKFAPVNRTFTSLLRGRSGRFDTHRFAPKQSASELDRECGQVFPSIFTNLPPSERSNATGQPKSALFDASLRSNGKFRRFRYWDASTRARGDNCFSPAGRLCSSTPPCMDLASHHAPLARHTSPLVVADGSPAC